MSGGLSVSQSVASHISETSEAMAIKLDKVTASVTSHANYIDLDAFNVTQIINIKIRNVRLN